MKYFHDSCGNLIAASERGFPQITRQPVERTVKPGEIATFSVVVADSRVGTFQWKRDGADLPGATGDSLLLTNISAADVGQYSVVVKSSAGAVTSAPAALSLDTGATGGAAPPRLTAYSDSGGSVSVTPMKLEYALGETVTLTATAFSPSVFAGWTGDLSGATNPATLTMNGNKIVRARFAAKIAPPRGLLASYRGEPATGNVAADILGGHDGAFYSGSAAANPAYTTGKVGSAFTFDGALHVRVPDSPALRPARLTMEAWVFPTTQDGNHQTILSRGSSTNDDNAFSLALWNGKPRFWSFHTGLGMHLLEGPSAIPLNQWTHLAASFDGAIKRVYVNGAQVALASGLGAIVYDAAAVPFTIGADWAYNGPSHLFRGFIDEASLYDRALDVNEVADLYRADLLGKDFARPYFTTAASLPAAALGATCTRTLTAVLGAAPLAFSIAGGALPPGLALSSAGVVTGAPSASGLFDFIARATDTAGASTDALFVLRVLQPIAPPAGIVAWWRGEPAAGSAVPDIVGGNHGAFYGGSPATTPDGKVGNAFTFNGSLHVRIPDAASLRPAAMTAEAWVYPTAQNFSHQAVIGRGSSTNDDNAWWMGIYNGKPRFWSKHANLGMTLLEAPSAIPLNQWTHLAISFDGATKRLYVNGAQVASQGGLGALVYDPAAVPVTVGADWGYNAPTDYFSGRIDEPSLYSRALTAAEILSIVDAGVAGKAPP